MCGGFPGGGQYFCVVMCSVTSSPLSILPTTLLFSEDGRSKFCLHSNTQADSLASVPPQECTPGRGLPPPATWIAWNSRDVGSSPEHVQILPLCLGIKGAGRSPRGTQVPHGCLCHLKSETPSIFAATPWCGDQGCFSMVWNNESCCSCESLKFPPRTLAKWFHLYSPVLPSTVPTHAAEVHFWPHTFI